MAAPETVEELAEAVRAAGARGAKLEIRGGGSKAGVGAERDAAILDMRGFRGIVDYDPAELVLTVRAGTPLAEVQAVLAEQGQMLAFEPFDHGPIFGAGEGDATIGGVVAAAVAGSRRISAGAARDHLLGFTAVSGRGESFVAGGKVVKNVTGFDLPKLMAGSWGRLAALTELSLKVLPAPAETATRSIPGLDPARAARAMAQVLGSAVGAAAVAYLPGAQARVLVRIEGFAPSVEARCGLLESMFEGVEAASSESWATLLTLGGLPSGKPLWRILIPASQFPTVADLLDRVGAPWLADWGGGLIWAALDDAGLIRSAASQAGGHAMLVRAPAEMRRFVPSFHPLPSANAALEARVVHAFDPLGIFDSGRFAGRGDAH
ncbi:glycolate oxidase subunit GlcE [Sphingosinicella sp. CPCC 101087]|uniref:glycolate oxidase subunit GlcE n=1 Tax=Sphingosinicella sp. CPCC 101087 TaxID=2497754 RepID=UPI001FB052EC|nr:glycolate oxidase subunit GlcE [Sphingosinicella sp. CPCC 101087]